MQRELQGVLRLGESTQDEDNLEGVSPSPAWDPDLVGEGMVVAPWWRRSLGWPDQRWPTVTGRAGTTLHSTDEPQVGDAQGGWGRPGGCRGQSRRQTTVFVSGGLQKTNPWAAGNSGQWAGRRGESG